MLLIHLKQAWQLLRQNKLFSGIYVFGTAIAIASTTIFAIIYYVKLAPVYPEYKRERMSVILAAEHSDETSSSQGALSYQSIKQYLSDLKNAETTSILLNTWGTSSIDFSDERDAINVILKQTDTDFFKVFNYDFIAGAPFNDIDFDSGLRKAAISDRLAEEIFGSADEAIGKTISIKFKKYDICGVFREGSAINDMSFAHVIVPFTTVKGYEGNPDPDNFLGSYSMIFLSDNLPALQAELAEVAARYNSSHNGRQLNFWNQPQAASITSLGVWPSDSDFDLSGFIRFNVMILLSLLIVPALNMSGMIAGRMDSRQSELGVRKAFGATAKSLLGQVLWENLFLTIIGGLIGLGLTWIVLSTDATFVLSILGDQWSSVNSSVTIRLTPDMMFAPAVFIFAFAVCLILNVLSAMLPAWIALRRPIVKSLK